MFQAAAGFLGGAWLSHKCSSCELPHLRRAADDSVTFRLSVRVLCASVPTLSAPGLLMRQRPRAEVALGLVEKETELAEFLQSSGGNAGGASGGRVGTKQSSAAACGGAVAYGGSCGSRCGEAGCCRCKSSLRHDDSGQGIAGDDDVECPWRFGDTLIFTARLSDLLGPGLRLRLRGHSDLCVGPLQLELPASRAVLLGETVVNLRKRVLPACVQMRPCDPGGTGARICANSNNCVWESPVLAIPLANVLGGSHSDDPVDGQLAAHLVVAFGLTTDPQLLLKVADDANRPLVERVVEPLKQCVPEPAAVWWGSDRTVEHAKGDAVASLVAVSQEPPAWCEDSFKAPLPGPPRSVNAADAAAARQTAAGGGGTATSSPPGACVDAPDNTPPLLSPDLTPEGWVCHSAPNGRVFWHHTSLGPAPWDSCREGCEENPPIASPFISDSPPHVHTSLSSATSSYVTSPPRGRGGEDGTGLGEGSRTSSPQRCLDKQARRPSDGGSFHERFRIRPYSVM
mmetsp:Transcript_107095/g.301395  ORF Transcript_107095/g.301395 Transcript_107095/m.301395 type:complete len:513 (+) Transcript_107095:67-1605(+)